MAPLVVENVRKSYRQGDRDVAALNGVSLDVAAGAFLAVMGASGSGKSTLLHLMAGLTKADGGVVRLRGENLGEMNDRQLTLFRRRYIGLVFQSFNLIPTLTAEENMALPLLLDGKSQRDAQARAAELLQVLGLSHRGHHRPDALSGGEQQRVAIGRALMNEPAVLLADEPTGNLDSVNSKSVCELLRDLATMRNTSIVMVTHEPTVAAYAQEVAVLKDGQLVERFSTQDLNGHQELAVRYQECFE